MSNYKDIINFIGDKAKYDEFSGGYIWGDNFQMIGEVRGWGAIKNMFKTSKEAADFQDKLGKFIAEAITEKINREKNDPN